MTKKPPPQGIPDNEMTEPVVISRGDYWVLQDPVTKQAVVATKTEGETLMCFRSEADALEFKRRYEVRASFVPVYIPKMH